MTDLAVETTPVPGLLVVRLDVHEDARGWFKEAWQREKMTALGLPDFVPVQQNIAFNATRGATRGIHAEPWDKFVSVSGGRAFAAWVDLREGPSFGATFSVVLDPSLAVFVPRGVGNSYQTLDDEVAYAYLVNEHWRPGISYAAVDLGDPTLDVPWPIPLADAEISEKDLENPVLTEVTPVPPLKTLIVGVCGQLGRTLQRAFPLAVGADLPGSEAALCLDLTDPDALDAWPWHEYAVVLNAAAYTAVDDAETPEGRIAAWAANATAPATLARVAEKHRITLVHYSSEYVFDGRAEEHTEDEPLSPLGVYAQSKAAGDLAVGTSTRHYLLRTSWLIGEGRNFVRTMQQLAADGVAPRVVDDQVGRLTFTDELARATRHLLETAAPYGTYHMSNDGPHMSWADVAAEVFRLTGHDPAAVTAVSTAEYAGDRALAPRPACSVLSLAKLVATGFQPADAMTELRRYVTQVEPADA